ncbi:Eukaryotic translation initiation factor 3 subunit G [Zancudomyces culisetae]|uniref:Eukaryotic translation initiation factor 3 subunit G n=1 Tax=Zancudomyces culisetae TaxID=1213189 RepID=A0A1R1PYW1_ZANCU|nr:Eukaryotic translation initiation factor 3 subunit G [Zancudomyces culisetae]|eukprot:OMH86127.1 Eukaryotic translation initiation factor 3 subunit G [Zancudomyces culisetae]
MVNTSWADDQSEEVLNVPMVVSDQDGVKVIVEYKINDDGRKVKITRKIKTKTVQEKVNKSVAERKKWAKFGEEKDQPAGPNSSTASVTEQVFLKLSQWGEEKAEEEDASLKESLASRQILCRLCQGNHFTAKCPYKDKLGTIQEITAAAQLPAKDGSAASAATSPMMPGVGGEKKRAYIPPHLRDGGSKLKSPEPSRGGRDEYPTIRLTNLSEDTKEPDVQALCRPFGPLARVFLAKHYQTGVCKGYAFVSYYSSENAEAAIKKLNGYGYDSLILGAEWSSSDKK